MNSFSSSAWYAEIRKMSRIGKRAVARQSAHTAEDQRSLISVCKLHPLQADRTGGLSPHMRSAEGATGESE
jgi:hypothetical protein